MNIPTERWAIAGIAGAVLLIAGLGFYFLRGPAGEPPPETEVAVEPPPAPSVTPPAAPAPEPEPFELPALDESDAVLRDLVAALSAHPGLAAWLVTDDLIRRFVVAVDNVAEGVNPARHVPFMRPGTRVQTAGEDPDRFIAPASHRRYDAVAGVAASLDPAGTAELYHRFLPLMDEAYAELGYPDTPFADTFRRAVDRVLDTPIVEGQPAVVGRGPLLQYVDTELENYSPVQKQLIGMGPDNLRTVQAALRDIATAIGLTGLPREWVLRR